MTLEQSKALRHGEKSGSGNGRTDSYISGYWHKHDAVDPEMPECEKEFDFKYADMFEVIIGTAKPYGLDPHSYIASRRESRSIIYAANYGHMQGY